MQISFVITEFLNIGTVVIKLLVYEYFFSCILQLVVISALDKMQIKSSACVQIRKSL